MNSKDILIVTRCFWPQCGSTELAISDLALNLQSAGHRIKIATVRWFRNWSESIEYHGIPVVRFAKPVQGPWTSFRYGRLLSRHLATQSYDSVIVSGAGDEAAAAIRCADESTPIIIRLDSSLCGVGHPFHRKHVECCLGADAVVANSNFVAAQLNRLEEMPPVQVIADGIRRQRDRLTDSVYQRQTREALSLAHPVLQIDAGQPLAISFAPFQPGSGLTELIECWAKVVKRLPQAKLWLLGDGPDSGSVWHRIVRLDIAHSVVMPGYFDNLNDLFAAADLYIHPSPAEFCHDGLLRALAFGVSTVSTELGDSDAMLQFEREDRLEQGIDWSRVILDKLIDRDLNRQRAKQAALRTAVCQRHAPQRQAEQYLKLMASEVTDRVAVAK